MTLITQMGTTLRVRSIDSCLSLLSLGREHSPFAGWILYFLPTGS